MLIETINLKRNRGDICKGKPSEKWFLTATTLPKFMFQYMDAVLLHIPVIWSYCLFFFLFLSLFYVIDEPNKRDWIKLITMRRVEPDKKRGTLFFSPWQQHLFVVSSVQLRLHSCCPGGHGSDLYTQTPSGQSQVPVGQWMGENRRVHCELTRIISCESQALYLPWIQRGDGAWTS